MKIGLIQRMLINLVLKPSLRRESVDTLKEMAKRVDDSSLSLDEQIVCHVANELIKE